ncbi:hypothetical protein SARC_01046 [Sphaeroforma arctica JP610]|uniref:Sugar phosphate transporter domain-containing protein n=1 Tax=Sphaeroforma arctica JP610 TaxID=667725 RepID=A0A0L0GD29_9EUKA|nr:hypothetical protein SARC_01046 [Sphaeroforma arctica JP610]KNC86814.1 hypothetical protein SARC_01046 [Sphaeroforma arctica JP610]|eukprot:XP_014160716.1 hypothetical protein SARC_01046 [Sphaeroforma arctica JP610]
MSESSTLLVNGQPNNDKSESNSTDGGEKGYKPERRSASLSTLARAELEKHETFLTICACIGWVCVSASNITLTNYILHNKNFKFPVTISLIQQIFGFVCAVVLVKAKFVGHTQTRGDLREYVVHVLPIGVVTAITLAAGGAVYVYLSVSFVQMLKGVSPVITMLLMFCFGMLRARPDLCLSIVIISLAGIMASFGEVRFQWFGFALMMLSQVCDVLKIVLTERLLRKKFENIIDAIYHIAPATVCGLLAIWSYKEAPKLMHADTHHEPYLIFYLFVVACSGFGVNLLFMCVVDRANSLTFKVLGQIKSIVMILCGMLMFGNHVSGLQWASYCVSLVGFALYQRSIIRAKKESLALREPTVVQSPDLEVQSSAPLLAVAAMGVKSGDS